VWVKYNRGGWASLLFGERHLDPHCVQSQPSIRRES
jgi:hypothetical protein